jgi:HD superfamily phosphohydrolase
MPRSGSKNISSAASEPRGPARSAAGAGLGYAEGMYRGISLISDPIHGYIRYTSHVHEPSREVSEKDIIDSPWVQRLRRIHQVQSAFWVYPAAEHSRFQHSLGVMSLAGRFALHLYPTFKRLFPSAPSQPYIEELLRLTGLLHDVGHGPFSHFFDVNYLDRFGITHEDIGQAIVLTKLAGLIRGIRRSPSGTFAETESLDPSYVAYLIKRPDEEHSAMVPGWLRALAPVFSGIYTADNLDYVLRDSYMAGVSTDLADVDRLLYYTFFSHKGMTLHQSGVPALLRFLNARLYLYMNMYYHRTTRAIDLHLKEIFGETLARIFPYNPLERLDEYLRLTEWYLLEEVGRWATSARDPAKRRLGAKWQRVLLRRPRWKRAYEHTFSLSDYDDTRIFGLIQDPRLLEQRLRSALPKRLRGIQFRVDLANLDPRPINPLAMGDAQIYIYNESSGDVEAEILKELFRFIPARVIQCRIFTLTHEYDRELSQAFSRIFGLDERPALETNI